MIQSDFILSLGTIFAAFLASVGLTEWVRRVLLRRAMLDIPNERSSHKAPVPRGGGWAMLAVVVPALLGAMLWIDGDARHAGLAAAVVLLAAISWVDDRRDVSAAVRLSLHLVAAWLGSLSFAPNEMLFGGAMPLWLDRAVMILGWAWFINLYNFMDGIDGITGVETISLATGIGLVMTVAGISDPFIGFMTLVLAGVCLGFLAHNWHPARLFLGDIGSVPLGYLTGFCLLTLAVRGHLAAALILPLYYLADSGITIGKRALRGERIWEAHRQHFYQYAARGAGRHDVPVYAIMAGNIGLIGAAIWSVARPWAGVGLAIVIVAVLLGTLHKVGKKV